MTNKRKSPDAGCRTDMTSFPSKAVQDEFYALYGRALAQWSVIESGMASSFAQLIMPKGLWHTGLTLFFTPSGFHGRAKLFDAGLTNEIATDIQLFFRSAISIAKDYAGTRNKLAHGSIVWSRKTGGTYQFVVKEPIDVKVTKGTVSFTDDLTSNDLEAIIANFGELALIIFEGAQEAEKPVRDFAVLMSRIRALPKQAHTPASN